jgi:tetratricopeptide (TPR) repeat protein
MKRILVVAVLVVAALGLGGCSLINERIHLRATMSVCEQSRFTSDPVDSLKSVGACSYLIGVADGTSPVALDAHLYRAYAFGHLHDYPRATADLEYDRDHFPYNRAVFADLADVYAIRGMSAPAIAAANAIVDDSHSAVAYSIRSSVYDELGDYGASLADRSRAIVLDPNNAEYDNDRCWVRAKAGKGYDLALADCNASLKLKANAPATLNSRGYLYYRMGSFQKALADIDASMKGQSDFASSLYIRGLIEAKMGAKAAAAKDEARAMTLAPEIAKSVVP